MINLDILLSKSGKFIKKNKGLLTTIGACIGVGATIYFTVKATTKVEKILENKDNEIAIKCQKKEVVKACVKPACSAALTIFCIVLTYRFGKQAEAGLLSLLAGAEAMRRSYREQVIDSGKLSPEEEEELYLKSMSNDNYTDAKPLPPKENYDDYKLYKESLTGEYFYATEKDILEAEIKLNRNINIGCCESFWFWLQCLTDNDTFKDYKEGAIRCGWSSTAMGTEEMYGYSYVDICKKQMVDEETGREYVLLYYPFLPHADYEDIDLYDQKSYEVTRVLKCRCCM